MNLDPVVTNPGLYRVDREVEREIEAGTTSWLAAQEHSGENTGDTETHVIFVELKEPAGGPDRDVVTEALGPEGF